MNIFRIILIVALGFAVSGCSSKFRTYRGPEVTSVQVQKAARKMYLLHNDKVLKEYDVALGFSPLGHKQVEGDGRTPEGIYFISHRNPESDYHLSLGITYPNDADRAFALSVNRPPGGDIFIHGGPDGKPNRRDWTAGCIAVTDRQIEVIYSMVNPGTPIMILP